ncbi:hypothetical protein HRbin36_00290 [bacterium HR36]|nr:hypothetical protein HRbin36_00290 [bacterium HR36]
MRYKLRRGQSWGIRFLSALLLCIALVFRSFGPACTLAQQKPQQNERPSATLIEMRDLVAKHVRLVREGRLEELRQLFTPRLREFITEELLKETGPRLAQARVEELVGEIRQLEKGGRHLVVVRSANGRLLTVFVWHHGRWLADTLWFR